MPVGRPTRMTKRLSADTAQRQRTAIYNAARASGAWGYVEPLSQTPTWVHFDRRYGTPACSGTTAGYPTLRRGSRGCYVMILQDALSTLGYQTGTRIDGLRDLVLSQHRAGADHDIRQFLLQHRQRFHRHRRAQRQLDRRQAAFQQRFGHLARFIQRVDGDDRQDAGGAEEGFGFLLAGFDGHGGMFDWKEDCRSALGRDALLLAIPEKHRARGRS